MDVLEKIFGSSAKVKIMRLFLFNPATAYDMKDVSNRAKVKPHTARKEISALKKIGFLKDKVFIKILSKKRGKKTLVVKKKSKGWILDSTFAYLKPLQNFLIHINPLKHNDIIKKLQGVGRIKLLVISGVFIQEWESRVDLLIVGNHLKKHAIDSVVRIIESEIGKEIKYSAFETEDFLYRFNMCDKLVRDILDYPHEKVINKLAIG